MTTKWQSAVPAIPPSWSQTFTLYFIPFTTARGNSSAQNLLVAPNTLRVKTKVLLVPYKCPSIWPHCLSDLISCHFSLLVLSHNCSSDQQNLPLHQGLCSRGPLCLKSSFPRSLHGLFALWLPSVSAQCYLSQGTFSDYPIQNVHVTCILYSLDLL